MSAPKRPQKRISFDENNKDLYEYLKGKKDASGYICALIRKDINQESKFDLLVEKLDTLQNQINNLKIAGVAEQQQAEQQQVELTIDEINDYLDFG